MHRIGFTFQFFIHSSLLGEAAVTTSVVLGNNVTRASHSIRTAFHHLLPCLLESYATQIKQHVYIVLHSDDHSFTLAIGTYRLSLGKHTSNETHAYSFCYA